MISKSIRAGEPDTDPGPPVCWSRLLRSASTPGAETASGLVDRVLARQPLCLPCATIFFVSERKCRSEQSRFWEVLSEDERQCASRLRDEGRRRHFIGGRAGLRCILSLLDPSGIPASSWRFERGPHGKPYLKGRRRPWSFNLSHASDLIAIAVSGRVEVGIDVERLRPVPSANLPRHLLSVAERRLLSGDPASDSWRRFLRIWAMKEAVAKCAGLGSAADFATIDTCAVPSTKTTWRIVGCKAASCSVFHTDLLIDDCVYFLSMAVRPPP
jgi:phosphopantetheinyl transferase